MPYLIQKNAEGAPIRQIDLQDNPVVFGRGEGADIVIDDQEVSRMHFRIVFEEGQHVLKDLDTTNGTWVNGERAEGAAILEVNDRIRAGATYFSFQRSMTTMIAGLVPKSAG